MCGILFALKCKNTTLFNNKLEQLKHRGSDDMNIIMGDNFIAGATQIRVSQTPIIHPIQVGDWIIMYEGITKDADDIIEILNGQHPDKWLLDGCFAGVLYNIKKGDLHVLRNGYPLYIEENEEEIWVCSEKKLLNNPSLIEEKKIRHLDIHGKTFQDAFDKHLNEIHVPFGIILNNFESCIIIDMILSSGVYLKWNPVHTYSVRMDCDQSHHIIDQLDTEHYEYVYNAKEALESIRDVIYTIEDYEVEKVRSAIPIYLLAKHMKKMGIKVVFSTSNYDVYGANAIQCRNPLMDSIAQNYMSNDYKHVFDLGFSLKDIQFKESSSLITLLQDHAEKVLLIEYDDKESVLYESIYKELFGV